MPTLQRSPYAALLTLALFCSVPAVACSLATQWTYHQTFGKVGGVELTPIATARNPADGRVWVLARYNYSTGAAFFYKEDANGDFGKDTNYNLVDTTRPYQPVALAFDNTGVLWYAALSTNAGGTDYKLHLRKRTTAGVWSDVVAGYQYLSGRAINVTGMVVAVSGGVTTVSMNGTSNETTGRNSWSLFRWKSSTGMTRTDVTPYSGLSASDHAAPAQIRINPIGGAVWLVGGQRDASHKAHAILLKEGTSSFAVALDYRVSPTGPDVQEQFTDIAFNSTNTVYWATHTYLHAPPAPERRSQVLSGNPGTTPATYSVVNTGYLYPGSNHTEYRSVIFSPTGNAVMVGGNAKTSGARWFDYTLKSTGGSAFSLADSTPLFIDYALGKYYEPLLIQDGDSNIWSLQGVKRASTSNQGQIHLKKLACQ